MLDFAYTQAARAHPQVKVLLVDNVDAHYWLDRAVRAAAGPIPAITPNVAAASVAARLTDLLLKHKLLGVVTRYVGGLHGDGWQLGHTGVSRAWQVMCGRWGVVAA